MTRNRNFALLLVAAFAVSSAAISGRAQITRPPIVIRSKPAPAVKAVKTRFEVLHMMINAVQVRSLADEREIHTFIYSDQIRDRMQALFNNGGFQYGDHVVIHYLPGSNVALDIKGKPSKPI
jgi:hypothetical protein